MRLAEGMRVGLEVEEGVTCVAVIRSVDGGALVVDLLDQIEHPWQPDGEVLMFVPDASGLHYWRGIARPAPEVGRISLTLVGSSEMMQRRQYRRYAVDLTAQVRSVRRGRPTRSADVHVIDLSQGGAKIVGTEPTETGDTVIINLDLGSGPLVATARVAMAYPDGEGRRVSHLAFSPAEESMVAGIEHFLSGLAPSWPA